MITRSPPRCPHFRFGVVLGQVEATLRRSVNEKAQIDPKMVSTLTAANGVGKVLVMRNTSGDARFENKGVETVNATAVTDIGVTTLDLGRRTTAYGRVEVVEVILYIGALTDTDMDAIYAAAQANYPALFA